jgi:hypothetical protein
MRRPAACIGAGGCATLRQRPGLDPQQDMAGAREMRMSDSQGANSQAPAQMTVVSGLMLLGLIIAAIVVFEYVGGSFLGVKSFFASFTLLWYWATVEKAEFKGLIPSVVGALVGVGLAWQMQICLAKFGMPNGLLIGLVPIVIALFVVIMNWLPVALNGSAMLYLTVLGAPAFTVSKPDFVELCEAIVLGAIFFAAVVYLAMQYVEWRNRAKAPKIVQTA